MVGRDGREEGERGRGLKVPGSATTAEGEKTSRTVSRFEKIDLVSEPLLETVPVPLKGLAHLWKNLRSLKQSLLVGRLTAC